MDTPFRIVFQFSCCTTVVNGGGTLMPSTACKACLLFYFFIPFCLGKKEPKSPPEMDTPHFRMVFQFSCCTTVVKGGCSLIP